MKIKNLRNKTLIIGGIHIQPDEEANVPDTEEIREMIKNGEIEAFNVKIKEHKR